MVERAFGFLDQRRRLLEFYRAAQFGIERGHDLRHVEFKMRGVIADKSADINRRGEHIEVSLFECADMVGADFGGLGDLGDREVVWLRAPRGVVRRPLAFALFSAFDARLAILEIIENR